MRFSLYLFLIVLQFSVINLSFSANEYGYLKFSFTGGTFGPADTKQSDAILLNEGDVLEVIEFNVIETQNGEGFGYSSSFLVAEDLLGNIIYKKPFGVGNGYTNGMVHGSKLTGPCTVYLRTNLLDM